MSSDQIILFSLFGAVFAALLWGRWRYDLIAFVALVAGLLLGVIPKQDAFSGFGHPATVIVALVLVVSRGLINSGAVDIITRRLVDAGRGLALHIGLMSGIAGALSAFMNNVAALALLMPVELQASAKAGRSPSLSLMPLGFATILGGLVTLIGTPPNIIIAAFREKALGAPFRMFDFAPVGLTAAIAGIVFVAVIGWRLIPVDRARRDSTRELFSIDDYVAELMVGEDSPAIGRLVRDLDTEAEEADAAILGLVRRGRRLPGAARMTEIRKGDVLVVEASPAAIDRLAGVLKLRLGGGGKTSQEAASGGMSLVEAVVPKESRIVGRSANSLRLLGRHGTQLLGVSRQGRRFRERVRKLNIRAGDVLLLLGPSDRLNDTIAWLGALPLADRGQVVTQHHRAAMAAGLFGIAVALASFGVVYLPVALAAVVALYVASDIVPLREVYEHIEWPVVVLLGSMIPLGAALEDSGGTALIAEAIVDLTEGYAPALVLTVLMVVTMTLSDVLNNTATTVIAAPIALDIANRLSVSADPFLMAVAIAASCAFLTPIGHKNNTLIMGPGGYAFGDYWRMGLPLEILVVAVSVPMILLVWPL